MQKFVILTKELGSLKKTVSVERIFSRHRLQQTTRWKDSTYLSFFERTPEFAVFSRNRGSRSADPELFQNEGRRVFGERTPKGRRG